MSTPTQQRDREFIRLCKLHYENLKHPGQNPTPYRIVLDVLAKPAPSYYVDYYYATSNLRRALSRGSASRKAYFCSRLWVDMLNDYNELKKRHPQRSFHELVLDLCVGVAGHPRFYISPRRALEIVKGHF